MIPYLIFYMEQRSDGLMQLNSLIHHSGRPKLSHCRLQGHGEHGTRPVSRDIGNEKRGGHCRKRSYAELFFSNSIPGSTLALIDFSCPIVMLATDIMDSRIHLIKHLRACAKISIGRSRRREEVDFC